MTHEPDPAAAVGNALTVGTRLRCAVCGSELIVIKKGVADVSCCGGTLEPVAPPKR
jgi:hypothetical protein